MARRRLASSVLACVPLSCVLLILPGLQGCGDSSNSSAGPWQESPDAGLSDASSQPDSAWPMAEGGTNPDGATPDAGSIYHVPDTPPVATAQFGDEPAAIFRWRADGTSTSPGVLSAGVETITVSRAAPFSAFRYAVFHGTPTAVSPGYLGDTALAAQSVGFTVQAWFRARAVDGARTLFSNTGGSKGWCLDVKDGYLQAAFSTNDGGAAYRHWVVADNTPIETGRWYHASVSAARHSDHWRTAFFVDGILVQEREIPFDHGADLFNSTERAAVAAEPDGASLASEGFDGDLHAVVVHNYPVGDAILGAPLLRDGGRYFGAPSYHDYLLVPEPAGTAGATPPYSDRKYNLARRIALTDQAGRFAGMRSARVRLGLPLLNDRYVPAGVAVSADGATMWLGYYFTSDTGDNPDGHSAIVIEAELPSYRATRILRLLGADGSAILEPIGGIAAAHGSLYATLNGQVVRFEPASSVLEEAADPDMPDAPAIHGLRASQSFPILANNAGVSHDAALDALWIAPANGGSLERYDLAADGAIEHPSSSTSDEHVVLPAGVKFVRGAVRIQDAAETCFLVSSFDTAAESTDASRIYRWCTGRSAAEARLTISSGAQAITMGPDATVWVVHQSGAAHLQKRKDAPQWYDVLSPYVTGWDVETLAPRVSSCRTEPMSAYFGDVHNHTSYSDGIELPADLFAVARDTVGLDFVSITDHSAKLTNAEFADCKASAAAATKADSFLALCGFEIAIKNSAGDAFGHSNVLFTDSFFPYPTSNSQYYDKLVACKGCLGQIDHPASTSFTWTNETLSTKADPSMALVELNGAAKAEALAKYFSILDHGWHAAPSMNSDTHALQPGNGGRRTGVFATGLDQASIKNAMSERRTFAGNAGNDAWVKLAAEGCWMGAHLEGYLQAKLEVEAADPAVGFATIELVTSGGDVLHTVNCAGELSCAASAEFEIDPAAQRWVVALAERTDGRFLLSAPIWLED